MIDDILNYESLIKLIIKEIQFEDYKIYENKVSNSILSNLLVKYKNQSNENYFPKNICRNFQNNISVIIPVYLKDCWIKLYYLVPEF